MHGKAKFVSLGVGVVAFGAMAMQAVPVDRSNPPVTMDVEAPEAVKGVLRRSCYDCHSNEVNWPWYSYVAPVSWLVAKDVREGREHVNFSEWDRYTPGERREIIEEVYEVTSEGEMPLAIYLTMHSDAKITQQDLLTLSSWANAAGVGIESSREDGSAHDDEHGDKHDD